MWSYSSKLPPQRHMSRLSQRRLKTIHQFDRCVIAFRQAHVRGEKKAPEQNSRRTMSIVNRSSCRNRLGEGRCRPRVPFSRLVFKDHEKTSFKIWFGSSLCLVISLRLREHQEAGKSLKDNRQSSPGSAQRCQIESESLL